MLLESAETMQANRLCVLVRVKNTICAFDSSSVEAILPLEEQITPLPESDDIRLGIIHYRNTTLSVLDLRTLMGMISLSAEELAFEQMLDQRKHDHAKWVDELIRCMDSGDHFHLATDPHKCAFGQWYDHYQPESYTVGFQLKKIDSPHRMLHESATKLFALEKIDDEAQRRKQQLQLLEQVTKPCMSQVLACLDETKAAFQQTSRKITIVLSDGHRRSGVLVDEVLAVEELLPTTHNEALLGVSSSSLVHHIAQRRCGDELILALDPQVVIQAQVQAKA